MTFFFPGICMYVMIVVHNAQENGLTSSHIVVIYSNQKETKRFFKWNIQCTTTTITKAERYVTIPQLFVCTLKIRLMITGEKKSILSIPIQRSGC